MTDLGITLRAVELAPRVWWVGAMLPDDRFQCHVYLIEQGDQSVIIDPGSALVADDVIRKVDEVVGLDNVRWLVCSHADPDVIGAMPAFVAHGLHERVDRHALARRRADPPQRNPVAVLADRRTRLAIAPRGSHAAVRVHALRAFRGIVLHVRRGVGDAVLVRSLRRVHRGAIAGRDVDRLLRRDPRLPRALHAEPRDSRPRHRPAARAPDPPHRAATRTGHPRTARHAHHGPARRAGVRRVPPRGDDPGLTFLLEANRTVHEVTDILVAETRFPVIAAHLVALARSLLGAAELELWAKTRDRFVRFDAADNYEGHPATPPPDVLDAFAGTVAKGATSLSVAHVALVADRRGGRRRRADLPRAGRARSPDPDHRRPGCRSRRGWPRTRGPPPCRRSRSSGLVRTGHARPAHGPVQPALARRRGAPHVRAGRPPRRSVDRRVDDRRRSLQARQRHVRSPGGRRGAPGRRPRRSPPSYAPATSPCATEARSSSSCSPT